MSSGRAEAMGHVAPRRNMRHSKGNMFSESVDLFKQNNSPHAEDKDGDAGLVLTSRQEGHRWKESNLTCEFVLISLNLTKV
jgi:hypothetical protein